MRERERRARRKEQDRSTKKQVMRSDEGRTKPKDINRPQAAPQHSSICLSFLFVCFGLGFYSFSYDDDDDDGACACQLRAQW
jgi:hypothetical protein